MYSPPITGFAMQSKRHWVANLRPIVNRPLVGQPILAAAGFQPALSVSRFVGFCRKRRSRQGSSVTRVNALRT
jgi:hypothetical protein